MAEKAKPVKRVRFKLPPSPSAATSAGGGGGGGGGDGAAAPDSAPRREPPSSPPRSPSPPQPFTYNPGAEKAPPKKRCLLKFTSNPSAGSSAGGDGDGGGAAAAPDSVPRPKLSTCNPGTGSSGGAGGGGAAGQEPSRSSPPLSPLSSSDEDCDGLDDEELDVLETRYGFGSLYMSDPQVLCMHSSDPQNRDPPPYIGRQNCEPLSTQKFFSLYHNWQRLLDGKKTYLRPPKNNRVAVSSYGDRSFVTPKSLEKPLQCQVLLSELVWAFAGEPITQQKYKILSEHYVCFRPVRNDGSQFYRAFLFSYLDNLGKMQGSQAEVTRLMECMARSRVNFCRLEWKNAYFSNPEAFFSSVISEFEHLVNSVANGLNYNELYEISLQEISSSRILSLLRLLTEVHLRTYGALYNKEWSQDQIEKFCKESVRPFGADVAPLRMRALSQALGIPLHLAAVDRTVQVECFDIIPRSGHHLSSLRRYYLSSATDKHPVLPAGNLFSSDRMPLVTLIRSPNTTAILYRK